jgi:hypothetical protein
MDFTEEELKEAARKAYAAGDVAVARSLIEKAKAAASAVTKEAPTEVPEQQDSLEETQSQAPEAQPVASTTEGQTTSQTPVIDPPVSQQRAPNAMESFQEDYSFTGTFTQPSPEDQALLDATLPNEQPKTGLTPTTVLEDKQAMQNIRKYMVRFQGRSADTPDEEMVEDFLSHQRKYAAGQSVVTLGELFSLQKADEEGLTIAFNAYDTFDRFEGVFSEDYTWGEMFDGLGSYARAVIIDPTNLLGLGIGRLIAGGSSKAGTVALKAMVQEVGEQQMKKTLVKKLGAKGARDVLAKQTAGEALKLPAQKAAVGAATQAAKQAEREVMRKAATTATVSSALKKQALKETAIATGVDSMVAVGVDAAYQEGMMLTGRQEEYDEIRSGLVALGGLVGGSIAYAAARRPSALTKQSEGILAAVQKYDPIQAPAKQAAETVSKGDNLVKGLEENFKSFSTFAERVARGEVIAEEEKLLGGASEERFFRNLMLGDKNAGTKGLAHFLQESGVQLPARPRYEGDNVTSFMADTLENLPKEQAAAIEKAFRANVGKHLPLYKDATVKDIANLMSYRSHIAGQQLQIFSAVKDIFKVALGKDGEFLDTTVDQALDALNPALGINNPDLAKFLKASKDVKDAPRPISYFQNLLIQTIVSHPGTTIANIKGSIFRGAADTVSDFVEGALYTGYGMRGFVTGNMDDFKKGVGIMKASARRPLQLVPSRATMAEAEDYIRLRPEVEDILFRFRSGGVENSDIKKAFNIDKAGQTTQKVANVLEGYKNLAQKLYFTEGQDRIFKNLNMMYYLDKNIEIEYGMSYSKFMRQSNAAELMQSERYLMRELKAVDETLSSVFAKSHSSKETLSENPIHYVATLIEEFRKIPVIGAAVPFGQFFNNTVDMMADYTGAKLLYRAFGAGEGRSKEAIMESMAKGATGWAAIWAMSGTEMNYIDEGLGVFEARDSDGQVFSKQYDFPDPFFKGIARVVAYMRMGQEVPDELVQNLTETFGPENLFRSAGQGVERFKEYFGNTFDDGIVSGAYNIVEAMGAIGGSTWVSGFTRPIDPINQMAGFFKEEGATVLDRRQGFRALNESARYIDQFPGVSEGLIALGSEERNTASRAAPVGEVGKIFGYRTIPEQSYTQRMMNGIERQDWQSGFAGKNSTGSAELDNRLNSFMFDHIEPRAARLLLSENWKKMNLSEKQKAVDSAWGEARKAARRNLLNSPVAEDFKLLMADKAISKAGSQKTLSRAMKELGLTGEIVDYDAFQIQAVIQELDRLERSDLLAPYRE